MEFNKGDLIFVFVPFDLFGNPGSGISNEKIFHISEIFLNRMRNSENLDDFFYKMGNRIKLIKLHFSSLSEIISWEASVKNTLNSIISKGAIPILIGGNHLSVLPLYKLYSKMNTNIGIVIFDAHHDLLETKDTSNNISHGNFLRHILPTENLHVLHVGTRDWESNSTLNKFKTNSIDIDEIILNNIEVISNKILTIFEDVDYIHIDVDFDVLDYAFMNAVMTSTPIGLNPQQLLHLIFKIVDNKKIIGMDFVEYNFMLDNKSESSLKVAIQIIFFALKRLIEKDKD